jgi:hypothetical protein
VKLVLLDQLERLERLERLDLRETKDDQDTMVQLGRLELQVPEDQSGFQDQL